MELDLESERQSLPGFVAAVLGGFVLTGRFRHGFTSVAEIRQVPARELFLRLVPFAVVVAGAYYLVGVMSSEYTELYVGIALGWTAVWAAAVLFAWIVVYLLSGLTGSIVEW